MRDRVCHSRPTENLQAGLCNKVVDCATLTSVTLCPTFWAGLGGGLSVLLSAIGAGFGIGTSRSALAAATAEKPDIFSRAVITLILAEALAIYALVTALLLVLQAS